MKRFDMHIHCGDQPVDPEKILAQMDACGIYGGVLMSQYPKESKPDGYDAETRMNQVLDVCRKYPDRLFPVLWIHPHEPNALEVAEEAVRRGIMGFKMLCDNYYVSDPDSMALVRKIAELGKPIIFHSGILWFGGDTSKYNRPLNWESLVDIKGLRFSLGHCSWPWIDECIALYGKFLNAYSNGMGAEMFFDTTPGTPEIYRKELLTKLYTVGYDVEDNVMFGTDCTAHEYNGNWAGKWLKVDGAILDDLGANDELYQKMYHDNLLRFLGLKPRDFVHTSPVCDGDTAWEIGKERASAAPIRYAREHYDGDFAELLPVLDDAYALYCKDDVTLSGDEKTDMLAGLLRAYRQEAKCEE
jgi:predicted TIM-barrel fold metal-dependent hydrolase